MIYVFQKDVMTSLDMHPSLLVMLEHAKSIFHATNVGIYTYVLHATFWPFNLKLRNICDSITRSQKKKKRNWQL